MRASALRRAVGGAVRRQGLVVLLAAGVVLASRMAGSATWQQPAAAQARQGAVAERVAAGGTQSSEGGRVTVSVFWDGLVRQEGTMLAVALQVTMDTHSVNLDAYDLAKLAELSNDSGQTAPPASWDARPGGHHRRGTLVFRVPADFVRAARFLQLTVRDVAGVRERQFRWELGVAS